MKIVNEKFIESLKGARNISAILTYNSNKSYRILTNEASENITTELNELLATEKGAYEVKDNQLLKINPSFNVNLFKTVCKSLEIETTENIAANEKINIKIGVKVDEDYQFLNYGNYIVKNSTYQADTDTYLLVAYDKMMESMIKYDDNPLSITYPIEHKNLIIAICEKLNWSYEIDDYLNSNAIIDKDLYSDQNLTYRDILDDLLTAVGENLLFDLNDKLVNKKIENSFLSDNIMGGNSLYLKEALESNALEYHVDGKSEQETSVQGKNLFDIIGQFKKLYGTSVTVNSTVFTLLENGKINIKGTPTKRTQLAITTGSATSKNIIVPLDSTKTYTFSTNFNQKSISLYYLDTTDTIKPIYMNGATTKSISNAKGIVYINIDIQTLIAYDADYYFQIEQGTATTYEPFVPNSPSPDYPSEIKTIKGIRNLFNKDTVTPNYYFDNSGNLIKFSPYCVTDYIKIEPNKKYTYSGIVNNNSSTKSVYYDKDKNKISMFQQQKGSNTIITPDNAEYVRFTLINDPKQTYDKETFMLEQGSVAHSYVPYGTYEKVKVTGKNIFNIQKWLNATFPVVHGVLNSKTSNSISLTSTADDCYTSTFSMSTITNKTTIDNFGFEIEENTDYTFYTKKSDTIGGTNFVFYFDKDYKYISLKSNNSITNENFLNFTTPPNAKYICFRLGINKSGNTVEFSNIMLLKGTITTTHDYEPYKEKEVLIDLAKENLFDKDNVSFGHVDNTTGVLKQNGISSHSITNDTISFIATANYRGIVSDYISVDSLTNYVLNCVSDYSSMFYIVYNYDNEYNFLGYSTGKPSVPYSFTTLKNTQYIRSVIEVSKYKADTTVNVSNIKIYKGTNADDSYELNSIGDTKDKLEIINELANIQKRIGKVILNGNENWFKASDTSANYYGVNNIINATKNYDIGLSSHFVNINKYPNVLNTFAIRNNGTSLMFNSSITTLADFKSWLKANPVTVYYKLATPETITLQNTDIPLYEGINHVTLVEDLETTTSIIYKKPFIIDDELLKDVNVDFKEKYGPVNSLTISSNNTVINSLEDKKSIEKNGKITFNINDNYLLNYNSDTFINKLFNKIYNLEYYIYDFDSTGILVLEALDKFIVNHNNNNYNCLMLNDDVKLTTGLIETTYAEKPEENVDEYTSVTPLDKKINNALISIDKANAEIVLKVDSNGKIAQARLDGDADKGSKFTIKADNIELEGYSTVNEGFIVTTEGNAQVHSSLFDVTNAKKLINPAVITVRNYNKGQAKGKYYADQIILSNNDGTDIFTVGDGNIGDYHGGVLTLGNDEVDSSITMYDGIINCVEVNQSSLESIKKNFEKLENGLSIVEKADIYKYNLKKENDDDKKHIGLVIGDKYNTPYEVISKNGNSIDTYSMISVAWQCIKELNDKINNLEKEISKLKGESK